VARITESDPFSDHPSPAQEAGALERVLAKAVADRVHRGLEAGDPGLLRVDEQVELAGAGVAQAAAGRRADR
jgi:hypothetical protein